VGEKDDLLKELQAQLDGLAKVVEIDTNLPGNMPDYLVTLNSLKKRIEAANKMDDLTGTQTGRTTVQKARKSSAAVARAQRKMNNMTPKQIDAAQKALNHRPPITDRRAAIEHTRKLNELGNDS
jgi:hypothetical protein